MKVKIGTVVYDAETQPIMVILTQQDKKNIVNMAPEATRYCCYLKDDYGESEIMEWMTVPVVESITLSP